MASSKRRFLSQNPATFFVAINSKRNKLESAWNAFFVFIYNNVRFPLDKHTWQVLHQSESQGDQDILQYEEQILVLANAAYL